jgi:hypothetical protein
MILWMLKDWKSDIHTSFKDEQVKFYFDCLVDKDPKTNSRLTRNCHCDKCESKRKIGFGDILYVVSVNWKEVGLICLMITLINDKERSLWLGMFILLCVFLVTECYHIWKAFRRYTMIDIWLYKENWAGIAMIVLVSILLYYDETKESADHKRHMASFAMTVSWKKLFTVMFNHPMLSK